MIGIHKQREEKQEMARETQHKTEGAANAAKILQHLGILIKLRGKIVAQRVSMATVHHHMHVHCVNLG